jgi:quercetin 2,3-dioxygenase
LLVDHFLEILTCGADHPHIGANSAGWVIATTGGNKGSLLPGNVHWMTAGRRIIHHEQPPDDVTVHSLQLWVNLPAADKISQKLPADYNTLKI